MRTICFDVFKYNELDDRAKERARDWYREGNIDSSEWAWENTTEDAEMVGIVLESYGYRENMRGHFKVSAIETANLIIENHGDVCETYKTAQSFLKAWNKLERGEDGEIKDDDKAEEVAKEFKYSILEDYRIRHDKELEYQNSDDVVAETIEANEYEFTKDGKRARSV